MLDVLPVGEVHRDFISWNRIQRKQMANVYFFEIIVQHCTTEWEIIPGKMYKLRL